MKNIAIIGLGNMGSAIATGLIKGEAVENKNLFGFDTDVNRLAALKKDIGLTPCMSAEEAIDSAEIVLLAVKPYHIEAVIKNVRDALKGKTLLSIALGYTYDRLSKLVDESTKVQHIMPNTPAMIGEGVMIFEGDNSLDSDIRAEIMQDFNALGTVVELPSKLMGIGGAVSGCGPAFVAMFIEALADAGVKYGLPRNTAYLLASKTLEGTGKMQRVTNMHPGVIKDAVCSPAGTTIRGVEALERSGLRAAMLNAVQAIMEYKV